MPGARNEMLDRPKVRPEVGGWLWLWCFGTILGAVLHLRNSLSVIFWSAPEDYLFYMWIGFGVFSVICGVLILFVNPHAINFVRVYFLVWAVLILIPVIRFAALALYGDVLIRRYAMSGVWNVAIPAIVEGVLWTGWFAFFRFSKRVRTTFGKNI